MLLSYVSVGVRASAKQLLDKSISDEVTNRCKGLGQPRPSQDHPLEWPKWLHGAGPKSPKRRVMGSHSKDLLACLSGQKAMYKLGTEDSHQNPDIREILHRGWRNHHFCYELDPCLWLLRDKKDNTLVSTVDFWVLEKTRLYGKSICHRIGSTSKVPTVCWDPSFCDPDTVLGHWVLPSLNFYI